MLEKMERMGNLTSSISKPHFFQPIHPDCSSADHLAIPIAFQRDYLVDREDSEGVATLKSPLKIWKVKLNDFKFTDGWPEFYKAHELSTGYFLAFQYEGHDLIFRVWVFDLSYCEVEYSITPLMSEGEDENEMHCGETGTEGMDRAESIGTSKGKGESEGQIQGRKEQTSPDDSEGMYRAESIGTSKGKGESEGQIQGRKEQTSSDDSEVEEDSEETLDDEDDEMQEVNEDDAVSVSKYPHFVATLKSYNIGRSFLTIPTKFAQSNIPDDVGDIVLIDEEGKEWPIKLTRRSDGYGVHFGFGWYDFQSKKRLKKGDICLFEQENEDQLEFTVSIIRIRK
ncbi:B3 domain-containing protein REM8-like [Papaver somniferum]|uniref:B3 domain-containing protein REM8-like n=1 Tax=Papaver somniferum TaxID=3469 RepID=UPI000E6F8282|nr:B3 domain-containing protein REM8-like [Papaver somniferum]